MALKPKASRIPPQGPHFTPLLPHSTVKLTPSKSLSVFSRPGVRLNTNSRTVQVSPTTNLGATQQRVAPKPALFPETTTSLGVPQTINRRLSMPGLAPSEHLLPRIRSRAASDPDLAMRAVRNPRDRNTTRSAACSAVKRCCQLSQVGSVLGRAKANNQDSYFNVSSFAPGAEMVTLGVSDGHGEAGHHVSGLAAKRLPNIIRETFVHYVGKLTDVWPTVLIESFKKLTSDLSRQSFDTTYSGATCVTVVLAGSFLICANVGDSRAVLARRNGASFISVALSRDHKPDFEDEKQRILDFGGRVEAVRIDGEDIGPLRVWLKHEDAPGLAMTRALGDSLAARIGVISCPEVITTPISSDDSFLILASDGIWEFISSQEAVDMAARYVQEGRLEEGCQALVAEATKRWRREEDCVDDITVMIAELGNCA